MTNVTAPTKKHVTTTESSHLRQYLNHYKQLENPGYGVLITGDWGSGKTFQVKEILTSDEIYYISLFGSQSTDEVFSTVYAKMFPYKSKIRNGANTADGAELGGYGLTFNVGGIVSGVANAILRDEVKKDRIIVFDDLERSSVDTKDLLGIFNKYIEHHECRVVVIAHDDKIATDLKDTKEKVFGQTLKVTPQISHAFDSFTNSIKDQNTKDLIKEIKQDILEIFQQSSTHSLRILKYTIEDLCRLFKALSKKHKSNTDAVREISFLFFALSLEVRSGCLNESDLINRSETLIRFQMKRARDTKELTTPNIYTANGRYSNIDLSNPILKDQPLINMLIKGNYIESEIQDSINESLHFARVEDLPAWLVLMKFDEVSDIQSNAAAQKLITQFDEREIHNLGEMLHLFALRFLLSDMEIIPENFSQTEVDCKQYIDDLIDQNKLPVTIQNTRTWSDEFLHGYNGYMFWVQENYKKHFDKVTEHLDSAGAQALLKLFPSLTKELLKLMATDGNEFARQISYTFRGGNKYARIDILASIDPTDFVQEWMGSPAHNWRHISRGLEQRYAGGELHTTLKTEKKWLKKVIETLELQHKQAKGIRKKRIERTLPKNLKDALK